MVELYQDDDNLLLLRLKEGCIESFNILYEKYWEEVYSSAFRRLKNHDQAEDITQDIFAYLWLKKEGLQIGNLPAYLHVAVRNRVLNLLEKERRYIPLEQLLYNNISFQGDRADAEALRNEFLRAYRALSDSMPSQRKKIFRYYYDERLSVKEIAFQLKISRKTVLNQLGRAAAFLRTELSHLFLLLIIFYLSVK